MRHNPLHSWIEPTTASRWSVDAAPRARLGMLYVVFLIPILLVSARLFWLQVVIPDRFISTWNQTRESFESIPARDGRILTADGQVLAYDRTRYSVSVHYRWIEEPVNGDWLKARARQSLPRDDRKNQERVKLAEDAILNQRDQLWRELSFLTGTSPEELSRRRRKIQDRIEKISESVNHRQQDKSRRVALGNADDTLLDQLWRELSTPPDRTSTQPIILKEELDTHPLIEDISVEQMALIESQPSRFPGVELQPTTERVYPQGDLAAHLVGLRVSVDEAEFERRRSRFPSGDPLALEKGDRYGRDGLERSYDSQLRGLRGLRRVVRNHAGEIIEQEIVRPPRHGSDLSLTLDASLQRHAEQLLDRALADSSPVESKMPATLAETRETDVLPRPQAGSIILLDLRTGDIVVAASSPRVDLNALQHPSREQWQTWVSDSRHPFVSRVTQATIPPGSLFKLVTAIAGVEQGVLDPEATFHCQGYLHDPDRDRCSLFRQTGHGHGETTLTTAISQSCNVYFFDLAEKLGPRPMEDWARRLGFGTTTGIDVGGEKPGHVPSRASRPKESRWYPGTTRQFAIGQGELTVTPLQVTQLMALIGNGGRRVTPHLVAPGHTTPGDSSTPSGPIQQVSGTDTKIHSPPLVSDRALHALRQGMELTVEHPSGTGTGAQIPGLLIAGQTSTAEVAGDKPPHAWFAGYVPAERPRYAFAVFLEHGGAGGEVAAPLARQILMSMIESDLLSPVH